MGDSLRSCASHPVGRRGKETDVTYEPVLCLRGEQVALGPTHAELLEEYWRWENDPVTVNGYGRQVPESLETRREGSGYQARGSLNQV